MFALCGAYSVWFPTFALDFLNFDPLGISTKKPLCASYLSTYIDNHMLAIDVLQSMSTVV